MNSLRRALYGLLMVAICAALAGCGAGEKRVKVTGKVVESGKPLDLSAKEYKGGHMAVELTFYPVDGAGKIVQGKQSFSTTAKEDGSFTVDGGDGRGIPVGKYRVALAHRDPSYRSPTAQGDRWERKFAVDKSPFIVDVPSGKEIVIDVGAAAPQAQPKS